MLLACLTGSLAGCHCSPLLLASWHHASFLLPSHHKRMYSFKPPPQLLGLCGLYIHSKNFWLNIPCTDATCSRFRRDCSCSWSTRRGTRWCITSNSFLA